MTFFAKNKYFCHMKKTMIIVSAIMVAGLFHGCIGTIENPNAPHAVINFTISLTDPRYYDLRFDGGFMYLKSDELSNSRGIIIYRLMDEFLAYDRLPPNKPNACCHGDTCSRLMVDVPFVIDNCNGIKYNILNGEIFEGDGIYPLFRYHTSYNMNTQEVHVYN